MDKKNIYKDDSIKSLSPLEFVRLRPGVYCGSTDYSTQLLRELFANALDEHNIGHGDLIEISINTKENIYTVTDHGQGFPFNLPTQEGRTILEDSFSILNTSGKYDDDGIYGASAIGLNGIGCKLATYLSLWLNVSSSIGDGTSENLQFKDGVFVKRELKRGIARKSGTSIQYKPDPQFFKDEAINLTEIRKLFKETSALCPKLTIKLNIDGKEEAYHSVNGLNDLVDDITKKKEIVKNRFVTRLKDGDSLFDICMTYTNGFTDNLTAYVNYGLTDSGVHITALKSNLTRAFNKYAADKGLFKKGETNLTGAELSEGQVIVFNLKAPGVQYDSQTKTRVTDIDKTLITEAISKDFSVWLEANPVDAETIIEKALLARRAKEAAKKAKEQVRGAKPVKKQNLKHKLAISDKLKDANGTNRKECELFLTEGNSAASSAIGARDAKTQAIMSLRGKVLNAEKTDTNKLLENKEINGIIAAIGAGFGKDFDASKSRYGKIILMTDADMN